MSFGGVVERLRFSGRSGSALAGRAMSACTDMRRHRALKDASSIIIMKLRRIRVQPGRLEIRCFSW